MEPGLVMALCHHSKVPCGMQAGAEPCSLDMRSLECSQGIPAPSHHEGLQILGPFHEGKRLEKNQIFPLKIQLLSSHTLRTMEYSQLGIPTGIIQSSPAGIGVCLVLVWGPFWEKGGPSPKNPNKAQMFRAQRLIE